MISLIAAMDLNRAIGKNGQIPWHLPEDLAHFKALTMGKPIVMGRKTYESIGRPLPGRRNIVVTRNPDWSAEGVEVFGSLQEAFTAASDAEEVMVIGGGEIYEQAIPLADRLYLTTVVVETDGADAFFPVFSWRDWDLYGSTPLMSDNGLTYSFKRHARVSK